jgi:hypothetical protein
MQRPARYRSSLAHVEVLLEVVAEREVQERPPVRRQLHRRGQSALDDGEVAGGEMPVELVHVRAYLEPVVCGQGARVDPRPGDDYHPQRWDPRLGLGEGGYHASEQVAADTGAPDGDDAHLLVLVVAELAAERCAVGELGGVKAGDIASEGVVLLGPLADPG